MGHSAGIRALAFCSGRWYAAGGVTAEDGTAGPGMFTSADGALWGSIATLPVSVYGPNHVFSSAACRDDTLVTVGSAAGGAHGNLRTNTWLARSGSALTEVAAPFEQYGGPNQIGVGQLSAGSGGFVMVGSRFDANGQAGAAVWVSADGGSFRLIDNDPALESAGMTGPAAAAGGPLAGMTEADAVTGTADGGFEAVGAVTLRGLLWQVPLAWYSPDGVHWQRQSVPGNPGSVLQQVVQFQGKLLAVGTTSQGFGSWLSTGGTWRRGGDFGELSARATGLVVVGNRIYAALGGPDLQLWTSLDGISWQQVKTPLTIGGGEAGAEESPDDVLLLGTDNATLVLCLTLQLDSSYLWRAAANG
jgi:hypothetical protein